MCKYALYILYSYTRIFFSLQIFLLPSSTICNREGTPSIGLDHEKYLQHILREKEPHVALYHFAAEIHRMPPPLLATPPPSQPLPILSPPQRPLAVEPPLLYFRSTQCFVHKKSTTRSRNQLDWSIKSSWLR